MYRTLYKTPSEFSDIVLESDGTFLTGLWFLGSNDAKKHQGEGEDNPLDIFNETKEWLDVYFSGKEPKFTPAYKLMSLSPFGEEVLSIVKRISYGQTITYGDIASEIAKNRGISRMSAQAVGGRVGANPICLIIPCHRVIGKNGSLVGYGGGLENKLAILNLEGVHSIIC